MEYGYNPEEINNLGPVIQTNCSTVISEIADELGTKFVESLKEHWYSQEAVVFEEKLRGVLDAAQENIVSAFETYRSAIDTIGKSWVEKTQNSETINLAPITGEGTSLGNIVAPAGTFSAINAAGKVFIDDEATVIAGRLEENKANIENIVKSETDRLNAELSFLGGGQAEALKELYNTIATIVQKIFDFLTSPEEGVQKYINDAHASMEEFARNVATSATAE